VSDVIVEHGEMSGRRRLHDLLPSDALLRDLTLEAQAEGFRMEDYTVPPGTLPAIQFTNHMIGVAEAVHGLCSMSWCGRGVINTQSLSRGLIFISSPGPIDIVRWDGEIRMLSLSIESATMEAVLPEPFTSRPVELLTIRAGASDPVLNHLLHAIKSEGENGYVGGRIFIEGLCHTTAIYLAQRYGVFPSRLPSYRDGLSHERLSRVVEYIDSYLADDLSINALAGVACLSPYHFGKMFRRSIGITVHVYVTQKRLARAQQLLRSTRLSLPEVALASGFYDQSQMTAVFRRYAQVTPRVYRLLCK
jgi:AraC family transcriptional regulator